MTCREVAEPEAGAAPLTEATCARSVGLEKSCRYAPALGRPLRRRGACEEYRRNLTAGELTAGGRAQGSPPELRGHARIGAGLGRITTKSGVVLPAGRVHRILHPI